ncbi:MAG: Hsp70 family protein [Myxococcota bacterium]
MSGRVDSPHCNARSRTAVRLLGLALALSCGSDGPDPARIQVEGSSPAVGQGARLAEAVGIATDEGAFSPILKAGCELPCERAVFFSTAFDGQTELPLVIYRGHAALVKENRYLGNFTVTGILPAPRGKRLIEVTLRADSDGISLGVEDAGGAQVGVRLVD